MMITFRSSSNSLPAMGSLLLSLTLLIGLFTPGAHMVKHGDFKRCDQSGFCVRQSAYADLADKKPGFTSPYSIVKDTLHLDATKSLLTAQLLDTIHKVPYTLEITFLERDTTRVKIQEARPLKPRYELPPDFALDSKYPATTPCRLVNTSFIEFGDAYQNSVMIQADPFQFEVATRGVPAFSFNEKGYFYYEHFRNKEEPPALANQADNADGTLQPAATEPEKADDEISKLEEKTKSDMWEEHFNGKTDSKPNGPTSIGFDVTFPGAADVYGIAEHATDFSLKSTRGENKAYDQPYRMYNLDVFEYILDSPMALYGSVPFMMSHKKGVSAGVFWLNAAEMWIDVERSKGQGALANLASYLPFGTSKHTSVTSTTTHWMAESGALDFFIFVGSQPTDIFNSYTALTGRPSLPQSFATAYHQCRWNYNDEKDVAAVDAGFEEHDIPYDVLWLDIEHTDGKRYFTWDKTKFPTPEIMQQNLSVKGRKMVTIIDPHIKRDDAYSVNKEAKDLDLFVKDKDGNDVEGWCWPGNSNWIDYTNPKAREYWARKFLFTEYKGSTPSLYTWNDMNEPSVFTGPETTMQKDALHTGKVEHRDVHNVYGTLMHRSTYEGHLLRSDHKDRPFVLSRAFFAGTQRYGPIWTGDNMAQWDHMEASVPMILSLGVSGITFSGADVGGFFGNPDADLLVRWYQVAAFQPFFRAHAHIDTKRREPWLFGEPYASLIRTAIRRRYALLPTIYTLFWEAKENGAPVNRPMVAVFPQDEKTFAMGDQYMLGTSLVIKPVGKDKSSIDLYLPTSEVWYDYDTFARVTPKSDGILTVATPLETMPVILRGGSIVTRRDRMRRSSTLMRRDPYTLVVALDHQGEAKGHIYIDDGHTFNYTSGTYIHSTFSFSNNILSATPTNTLSDKDIEAIGSRVERIILVGAKSEPKSVVVDGRTLEVEGLKVEGGYRVVIKDPGVWVGRSWEVNVG
ncbi:glycosyl hydrolases family 31-domain-containing protein [Phlyctochytrium arcticum]|nr:glycosyl hydrolases family 31-domain-containing protein [Phlyctochytrium arcticum]